MSQPWGVGRNYEYNTVPTTQMWSPTWMLRNKDKWKTTTRRDCSLPAYFSTERNWPDKTLLGAERRVQMGAKAISHTLQQQHQWRSRSGFTWWRQQQQLVPLTEDTVASQNIPDFWSDNSFIGRSSQATWRYLMSCIPSRGRKKPTYCSGGLGYQGGWRDLFQSMCDWGRPEFTGEAGVSLWTRLEGPVLYRRYYRETMFCTLRLTQFLPPGVVWG